MPWHIEKLTSRSYEIVDRDSRPSTTGWDEATLQIVVGTPNAACPFLKGTPHPEITGLYCSLITELKSWHGCPMWRLDFSGVAGGGAKTLYDLVYGYDFTQREIVAADYPDFFQSFGTPPTPKIVTPGGRADQVNLLNLVRSVQKRWITSTPPPSSMTSLVSLAPDHFSAPPANVLSWLGMALVYTEPNGMIPTSASWQKHSLPQVAYWLADVTWKYQPATSIAG